MFYKLTEVLGWIAEIGRELRVWTLRFVENVVADGADIKEMSRAMQERPLLLCSSGILRARRPRLFWCNVEVEDRPSFDRMVHERYDELVFRRSLSPWKRSLAQITFGEGGQAG